MPAEASNWGYMQISERKRCISKCCKGCEKYPGMRGFERLDAQTFASWEIDYLKVLTNGRDGH
eukprot:scaffold512638_cov37-Prasinocladus_malaysianus.AAC.1